MSEKPNNINISKQNIQGKCDLKCFYVFKYNDSNLTAKNDGVMISLTYDNTDTPVTYNNQKYTVSKIYITSPSIHTFNNKLAVGEITIEHLPKTGGSQLNVSIPFISSPESTTATNLLTEVINTVSLNAPSEGETVNINVNNFSLQNIVPKKPFYSYTDNTNINWIIFDILDAIPLSDSILKTLDKIIKPYSLPTLGNILFYN
jgi:carbonic anhydrase